MKNLQGCYACTIVTQLGFCTKICLHWHLAAAELQTNVFLKHKVKQNEKFQNTLLKRVW